MERMQPGQLCDDFDTFKFLRGKKSIQVFEGATILHTFFSSKCMSDAALQHGGRIFIHIGDQDGVLGYAAEFVDYSLSNFISWKVMEEAEAQGGVELIIAKIKFFQILFLKDFSQSGRLS